MNFTTLIMLIFTSILAIGLVSKGLSFHCHLQPREIKCFKYSCTAFIHTHASNMHQEIYWTVMIPGFRNTGHSLHKRGPLFHFWALRNSNCIVNILVFQHASNLKICKGQNLRTFWWKYESLYTVCMVQFFLVFFLQRNMLQRFNSSAVFHSYY